jgi:hypothetical protein
MWNPRTVGLHLSFCAWLFCPPLFRLKEFKGRKTNRNKKDQGVGCPFAWKAAID